jgi:small redox-active disulfide protein 2
LNLLKIFNGGFNKIKMEIKILGTGCSKCKTLEKLVQETISGNNINSTIIKVDNFADIAKYNVMSTPALVIDDAVKIKGRIPTKEELKTLLWVQD